MPRNALAQGIRQIEVANPAGAFIAGRQARQGYEMDQRRIEAADIANQTASQRNALGLMMDEENLQTARRMNGLASNPNATASDYARAGRSDVANALNSQQRFDRESQMDAATQLAQIARQALTIKDPMQRRSFAKNATMSNAPLFKALGVDVAAKASEMDALSDPQLESLLQGAAAILPAQDAYETIEGPGGSVLQRSRDGKLTSVLGREPRASKGMSVTLPDGTVMEIGGDGSEVGPGELTKPTINNLQETIVNSSNRLDRLNQVMTTYKPDYLRAKGLIKAGAAEVKDFLGMDVNPRDKEFLRGYAEFRASASQEFSATLKELSGTAASESEVLRVMKGVPSDADKSPEVFEAKAQATTKFITRAIMRANWALKNGIGIKSVNELSKRMPLEGIDGVYASRANQIWQEMGGTTETRAQAVRQANQEFGIAR